MNYADWEKEIPSVLATSSDTISYEDLPEYETAEDKDWRHDHMDIVDRFYDTIRAIIKMGHTSLSFRERCVMLCVCDGLSERGAAGALGICRRSVRVLRDRAVVKFKRIMKAEEIMPAQLDARWTRALQWPDILTRRQQQICLRLAVGMGYRAIARDLGSMRWEYVRHQSKVIDRKVKRLMHDPFDLRGCGLSWREGQVFKMVEKGFSESRIADFLEISRRTVRAARDRAFDKVFAA